MVDIGHEGNHSTNSLATYNSRVSTLELVPFQRANFVSNLDASKYYSQGGYLAENNSYQRILMLIKCVYYFRLPVAVQ
jgi:hypothetical protein